MKKFFNRYLSSFLAKDLKSRIVLVTGPRQAGKTTLAKSLNPSFEYINYDEREHHNLLKEKSWDRKKSILFSMNCTKKRTGRGG